MRMVILSALAGMLAAAGAAAQTRDPSEPLRLTVDQAVQRALATSHRIAEGVARGESVEAVVVERHALTLPLIAAQAGYARTNHVDAFSILLPTNQLKVIYPDVPDNYRARLDLQWPIYTGGRLDALERAARHEATAASDEVDVTRSDLTLEVRRAYWALVIAGESLRVVEDSVTSIDAHLKDVRNQLDAGLVSPSDVFSVEAQASRQRMLTVQARSNRDVAQAQLLSLVRAPPGTPIEPLSALDALAPAPSAIDPLIETARQQRPERAALLQRVSAADERRRAATGGQKPVIAVGAGVDYANPNPRIFPREDAWHTSWDAGVNVNWAIFDGGRVRGEIAEAAALTRAVRERLADFDQSLALEVRQRVSELAASRAAIEAASDAVRSAAEARRVLGERFNAGVATSTDLLDAQVVLLQTELDHTLALANAHLADARLARALGR